MSQLQTSPEELARIERFIAVYNELDDFFQAQVGDPQPFRSALDWFARRNGWWRDGETLRTFAALRNFLVHEKVRPFDYPCTPSEGATREIERIRDALLAPATLGEVFGREVEVLRPDEPLGDALKLMHERGFGRFPLVQNGHFRGLLDERSIARHLAKLAARKEEFDPEIPVARLLDPNPKRRSFRFAAPDTRVAEVAFWFHEDTFLEAVLISRNGRESGELMGIVTRGDVAGWRE